MTEIDHHLTPRQIAAHLAGGLPEGERAEVLRHLDGCASCRHELLDVGDIVAGLAPAASGRAIRRRLVPIALALAAGLGAIVIYRGGDGAADPAVVRAPSAPGSSEGIAPIAAIGPADGEEVTGGIVLRWRARGEGSYDVFLLDEDGRPVWSANTTDTVAPVPDSVRLLPSRTYFWRVDAVENGIVATTGVRRLTVRR